ncbi:hypothetical protein ID866_9976 [Astraeus odoratus]|nr:hypothetical protein ID866_9976 [Astraeus odoratus]
MRLIDVRVLLDLEKSIEEGEPVNAQTNTLVELDDSSANYAILSHRWCHEVNYDEIVGLTSMEVQSRDRIRARDGYKKLVRSCCIDKRSSSELSEAINSMYRCKRNTEFRGSSGWPEWFTRGWTLQELIAPKEMHFFNKNWDRIGDKRSLASTLHRITQVPKQILRDGMSSNRPCAAQIISWAADRKTTREEDRAYSLLGLLGVNMSMLYGEGKEAFHRL